MNTRVVNLRHIKWSLTLTAIMIVAAQAQAGYYKAKPYPPKNPDGGVYIYEFGTGVYGGAYGADANHPTGEASCSGQITTIYEWVPDSLPGTNIPDPADLPQDAIVEETCTAMYSGVTGDCDNGLGHPAIPLVDIGAISFGTRYKKVTGAQTITLTCSPSASGLYGQIGPLMLTGFASVWYSSKIYNPTISYTGVTNFPDGTRKFITGQQIETSVGLTTYGGSSSGGLLLTEEPNWEDIFCLNSKPTFTFNSLAQPPAQSTGPTIDPASYQWSASGAMPFKNYIYGSIGAKTELANPETTPTLKFYTVDNGDVTVTCSFTVTIPPGSTTDGNPLNFTITETRINSVRPTLESWEIAGGSVVMNAQNFGYFGPGQNWTAVEMDIEHFGKVGNACFLQLINADRKVTRVAPNPTVFVKTPAQAQWACDTGFPYDPVLNNKPKIWPLTTPGENQDSPSQPLEVPSVARSEWVKSEANDQFKTWAMYRPPAVGGLQTTWIPIAKYDWQWGGIAERQNGSQPWQFTVTSSTPSASASETTEFPFWTIISPGQFNFIPQ